MSLASAQLVIFIFHKMLEHLISLGPLLLCPILLSCATSPQITGRHWQALKLCNGCLLLKLGKNDTITTKQVSAVVFSASVPWLGGKPLGCSWDWACVPTSPHQCSLMVLCGEVCLYQITSHDSGLVSSPAFWSFLFCIYMYINTDPQTKQAMGLYWYI